MSKNKWEEFFPHTTGEHLVELLRSANKALNIAINHKGMIIHPGAFIVFHEMIAEIEQKSAFLSQQCEKADIEMFFPEPAENKESEANG